MRDSVARLVPLLLVLQQLAQGQEPNSKGPDGQVTQKYGQTESLGVPRLEVTDWGVPLNSAVDEPGRLMSLVIDDDMTNRRANGLIGVQVHIGPHKIEYRKFLLKTLDQRDGQ